MVAAGRRWKLGGMTITVAPAENGMFEVQRAILPDVIPADGAINPDFLPLPSGIRFQASTVEGCRALAEVAAEQLDAIGYEVSVLDLPETFYHTERT